MKYYLILLLFFIPLFFQAQPRVKGKINKYGFFEFSSRRCFFSHIAHFVKAKIDGETFSYSEKNGVKYVFSTDYYTINNNLYDFNKLSTKEIFTILLSKKQPLPLMQLNVSNSVVKDSILNSFGNFSKNEFYLKFIDKNGVIIDINDIELEKAIVFKLISSNIPVYRSDVSGDLRLSKNIVSYFK